MAMTLADVRAKYPQYAAVDDQKLADAIYNKHYAGKDRREFDARIGLKPYMSDTEGALTAVGNVIPQAVQSVQDIGRMGAESVQQFVDPINQPQPTKPLAEIVQPGAPIAEMLDDPASPTYRSASVGALLPDEVRLPLARGAAEASLRQQLQSDATGKTIKPLDMDPDSLGGVLAGSAGAAVEMAAPAIASLVLRNPAPLITYFGTRVLGQSYGEARRGGAGIGNAQIAAGLKAAAEVATEAFAGKVFVEGGKTLLKTVLKNAAVEGLTEAATEALQALVDVGVLHDEMTVEQAAHRVADAGLIGAITGGVVSGATYPMRGKNPAAPAPVDPQVATEPDDTPIEDRAALPGPPTLLALPSPETFAPAVTIRRQPPAPELVPVSNETLAPSEDQINYQAKVALQRTKQAETAELLQTARETITPLGTFDVDEIGPAAAGKVRQHRIQMGRSVEAPVTIEDMARAKVPQRQIDAVIATRRPVTSAEALTALDIMRSADAKNIIPTDSNFAELALRTTGQRNVQRMTQAQLNALKTTLDAMPAHPAPVTVPLAEQSPFTDEQYGKALDAVRQQGRYTAAAIKQATGFKATKEVDAIRDAMVRRGQLVERGKGDYRLYDTLGVERQSVPDDLPPGAFKEYTTRRVPVSKVRVTKDGKSAGTFASAGEARSEVSKIREKDKAAAVKIEPAEETAWGVMENRYDEQGNFLGSVVVDTHRDEAGAQAALGKLNTPSDTGARYTQTAVTPTLSDAPIIKRDPMPPAFTGRLPEIVKRLNDQARDRKLPLLGVRVAIKPSITTPEGEAIEGFYFRKLISLTAQNLTPDMSTDTIVEKLGQVMDHETIHALRAAGVLGPETDGWTTIVRYARRAKRPGGNETYLDWARRNYSSIPGYENPDTIEEEAIAEAFRAWASNRRNVAGKPATVLRQIVEWFKRLLSSTPEDAFRAIETGTLVTDALKPPGGNLPRAKATRQMEAAAAGVSEAQKAKDENLIRVKSREYLRARAQARDDRYGKSGPKTVLGTNPAKAYATGDVGDVALARSFADEYRSRNGVEGGRLMTLLPVDPSYMKRVSDAQQRGVHSPGDAGVAKAYRALIDETKAMYQALSSPAGQVTFQTAKGSTYTVSADGTTTRDKAYRPEHGTAEQGPQPKADVTFYVTPEHANELGLFQTEGGPPKKVVLRPDGFAGVQYEGGQFERRTYQKVQTKPAVGLLPVETWKGGTRVHFGNPIVSVTSGGGPLEVTAWAENGPPYASPAEMLGDIASGKLTLRLSDEMFGPGADNPGHPLNAASGFKTVDGSVLTNNDLFRIVHDVYGHGQSGFRDDARGAYNAYHEHARLLSPEASRALATETLAQRAWQEFGSHLRRRDGTVPRETDVDYLPANQKEFAEQKAFLLDEEVVGADPGWALADKAAAVEEEPRFSRFDDNLPGGRLYGNPNRSPGGALSKPGTPSPAFTSQRPGNVYFGGELADEQLRMAQVGERGAALVYLSPEDFLALAGGEINPEQEIYDEALAAGYKFSGMPSLVIGGYAGNVRAVASDGAYVGRALPPGSGAIPVVLYPKNGESLGLVTALEAPDGSRVPWPKEGRAENFPEDRVDGGPKYSLNSPYGQRVPDMEPTPEEFDLYAPYTGTIHDPLDDLHNPAEKNETNPLNPKSFNIVHQRVEGAIGKFLQALGRNKSTIPLLNTSIFDFRVKWGDEKFLSVKEMLEKAKAGHGVVNDLNDAWLAEMLYHGRVFDQVRKREEGLYMDLMETIRLHQTPQGNYAAIELKDVEDFLYAMHAPERNAYLRAKGSNLENPSGMSDAEASAILDQFAIDGKLPVLQMIAEKAWGVVKDTNDVRYANGLISKEVYESRNFDYYVPLRGLALDEITIEDLEEIGRRDRTRRKGFSVRGPNDKSMDGRDRKAGDIISHLFMQNTESIIRAEKNNVAKSFIRFILDNPNMDGYGKVAYGKPPVSKPGMTVVAKVGGKDVTAYEVPYHLARALNADYPSSNAMLLQWMGKFNRMLATLATQFSPVFTLRNFLRDGQFVALMSNQFDIKGLSTSIMRDAPAAMGGIREVLRKGTAEGQWAQAFNELQELGGTADFIGINDLEQQQQKILKAISNIGMDPPLRRVANLLRGVGKFITDYGRVVENAFRLSAFVNARRAGATPKQSAALAKRISTNFTQGAENKTAMNAWYMFYNANIVGTAGQFRGLKNGRVQMLAGAAIALGFLVDVWGRAVSPDDDDNGVKDYDEIAPWVKQNNWVFMDPFGIMKAAGINKNYIAFPMPYGLNIFPALGRNISAMAAGKQTIAGTVIDQAMTVLDAFNPLGGIASLSNFIAPTVADPLVDLETNRDFADRAIVPERPTFGAQVPESQKYWSSTGPIPKDMAAWLNNLTGGNEARKGWADISPESMQYVLDYLAPGGAGLVLEMGGSAWDAVRGEWGDKDITDTPIINKFFGSTKHRSNQTMYYTISNEVQTVGAEMDLFESKGDIASMDRLMADKAVEVQMLTPTRKGGTSIFARQQREIADLRKAREEALAAGDKPLSREIDKLLDANMAAFNKAYLVAKGLAEE